MGKATKIYITRSSAWIETPGTRFLVIVASAWAPTVAVLACILDWVGLGELSVFVKRALRQNRSALQSRPRRCADLPRKRRPKPHLTHRCGRRPRAPSFVALLIVGALAACATKQERPVNSGPDERASHAKSPHAVPSLEPVERPAPSAASEPVPRAVSFAPQESLPRYPFQLVHSPITSDVAAQIRQVAARHPERSADRFAKVGDSITRSAKFLTCLADADVGALDPELRTTWAGLRASPFDSLRRESACAENGWSSWQPLAGRVPPLTRELGEVQGLFAFVMLGTNDIETSRVTTFARRFTKLVDATLAHGSVPLVSTIPERRDRELSRLKVPRFNAAIRAVAQSRRIPLVDLHHALAGLPNEGLSSDGIHPSVLRVAGRVRACDFGIEGLRHGFNVRNWVSLQALRRAQHVLEDGFEPEPAAAPGALEVEGRLRVAALPLVEVRALGAELSAGQRCSGGSEQEDEPRAIRYDISLPRAAFVEVLALASQTAESLAIELTTPREPARCLASGNGFTRTSLGPGDFSVAVRGKAETAMVALLLGRSGGS